MHYVGMYIVKCLMEIGGRQSPSNRLGLLLVFDGLFGGQRILLARLCRLQLLGVKLLDAVDEVELLLFRFDGYRRMEHINTN